MCPLLGKCIHQVDLSRPSVTQPPLVLVMSPAATPLTGISLQLLWISFFLFFRDPSKLTSSMGAWHCSFHWLK